MPRTSFVSAGLAVALALTGVGVAFAPSAGAASPAVSVTTPTKVTTPYRQKAKVVPAARARGDVQVLAKRITIRSGKRVVVNSKPSASLAPGRYTAQTAVEFRYFTIRKTRQAYRVRTQVAESYDQVRVSCAIASLRNDGRGTVDFTANCVNPKFDGTLVEHGSLSGELYFDDQDNVRFHGPWTGSLDSGLRGLSITDDQLQVGFGFSDTVFAGRTLYKTVTKYRTVSSRVYSKSRHVTRVSRGLTVVAGKKPRTCATYADFKKVRADFANPRTKGSSRAEVTRLLHGSGKQTSYSDYGDQIIEFRSYKPCSSGVYNISVGFENGYAYDKSYSS